MKTKISFLIITLFSLFFLSGFKYSIKPHPDQPYSLPWICINCQHEENFFFSTCVSCGQTKSCRQNVTNFFRSSLRDFSPASNNIISLNNPQIIFPFIHFGADPLGIGKGAVPTGPPPPAQRRAYGSVEYLWKYNMFVGTMEYATWSTLPPTTVLLLYGGTYVHQPPVAVGQSYDRYDERVAWSNVMERSYIFTKSFESKHGMAHWKKVTLNTEVFMHIEPTPINPLMTNVAPTNFHPNILGGTETHNNWIIVTPNRNDSRYPPFGRPPRTVNCFEIEDGGGGPATGGSGWNIRMWAFATNDQTLANINWMDSFTERYYVDTFKGTVVDPHTIIGTEQIWDDIAGTMITVPKPDNPYIVEQKRVKPMADIVITKGGQPVKNYGTLYLSPANYAGYVPEDPLLDTYIPGGAGVHNTHNVTFDLTLPGINPQGLYGRYLILLFQVYPYSRYRIQDSDIAINMYKPKLFHTAHTLSHLEYQIPAAYNWLTLDTPSMVDPDAHLPGHIKSGLPATPPFEVPPLTSVPIINDMEIEYSILEFDAFLSNYSAGLEFSTDHTSRYFEWRAIQNFISGTYEAGTVLKGY